jgi:hypothetical protein
VDRLASRIPVWLGSVAMVAGAAAWMLRLVTEGVESLTSRGALMVALFVGGCLLDLLVAWRGRRGRPGVLGLLYVLVRFLASIWLDPLAAACYLIAALAWTVTPAAPVRIPPHQPHAFVPTVEAWRTDALPLHLGVRASTVTAEEGCLVCGARPDDTRHATTTP